MDSNSEELASPQGDKTKGTNVNNILYYSFFLCKYFVDLCEYMPYLMQMGYF